MMWRVGPILAVMIALVIGGAAPTFAQSPRVYVASELSRPIAGSRVVLMPAVVSLYELTASGSEFKADWTATAKGLIDGALPAELASKVGTVVPYAPPPREQLPQHLQVLKLHGLVVRAVFTHYLNPQRQLLNKGGAFDWGLGESARVLRGDQEADYALFTEFVDTYSSGGRVALNAAAAVFGGVIRHGRQVLVGSLVDLTTGNIVWFDFHTDASSDLRTIEPATKAVQKLLRDMPR